MKKVFLDTSFIMAYVNSNDSLHKSALELEKNENILSQECYINNNVLNEVFTLSGRKLNIDASEEIYYGLIDSFEVLNEYNFLKYTERTFDIFKKAVKPNSKKTKLSFTDSSIVLTMLEANIDTLVSFDKEFANIENVNLIGLEYLK